MRRGALQAIVGSSAQFADMDISQSELIDQMRKKLDSGIWTGVSPMDRVPRIIAYQRVPGRETSVLVGVAVDSAIQPLAGLAAMAHGLAMVASIIVLTISGILIWTVATQKAAKLRQRNQARTEMNLANARQEIAVARARSLLTEPEVGVLMSSPTTGWRASTRRTGCGSGTNASPR